MKTVYTCLYLLFFCSFLLLSACNDCTTTVTQFENGDGAWTVYNTGDTFDMVDKQDTTVYTFANTRVSSEPVPGEGFRPSDACIEQYDTRRVSVMQEPTRKIPGLSVVALRQPNTIRVNLVVINRADFQIPDINSPQHAQLPVNGRTYSSVFELINNESEPDGVKRILFNQEFGFLQVEYASGRILSRVP